jgi:hypothetical protein
MAMPTVFVGIRCGTVLRRIEARQWRFGKRSKTLQSQQLGGRIDDAFFVP